MNDLRGELQEVAEAIDMVTTALDMSKENDGEYDPQLVEQLDKLLKEKAELVARMKNTH